MLLMVLLVGHWDKEPGIRVENGSVPYIWVVDDTAYRLYYAGPGGILSAWSGDGLSFTYEPGVRIPPGDSMEQIVADPSVVRVSGGMRMYYKGATGPGGPGQARHRIFSAFSTDGLAWTKEGLRYQNPVYPDNGWTSVPDALRLNDGRVRIYYTSATGGIRSIISDDGLVFAPENGVRLPCVDPNVLYLPDSSYRMFFAMPVGQQPHIGYADSPDGLNFTIVDTIISPGGPYDSLGCVDPSATPIGPGRFRVYYGGMGRSRVVTLSAVTPPGAVAGGRARDETPCGVLEVEPNPTRGRLLVKCSEGDAVLVYDAGGRLVRRLPVSASAIWNGDDEQGRPVPAGVYFLARHGDRGDGGVRVVRVK
jgi:predicted GH43/DUF377 family glycosyl hydrolase